MIKKIVILSTLCAVGLVSGLNPKRIAEEAKMLGVPQKGAGMNLRNGGRYQPFYHGVTTLSPKTLTARDQKLIDRARIKCSTLSSEDDTRKFENASRRYQETLNGYERESEYSAKKSYVKPTMKLMEKIERNDMLKRIIAKQPETSKAPLYTEFDGFSTVERNIEELEKEGEPTEINRGSSENQTIHSDDYDVMIFETSPSDTHHVNSKTDNSRATDRQRSTKKTTRPDANTKKPSGLRAERWGRAKLKAMAFARFKMNGGTTPQKKPLPFLSCRE